MIAPTEFEQPVAEEQSPTLWGLTPEQLHARYWKSRGIQIVSNGSPGLEINRRAEIYLLVSQSHLVIMQMQRAIELLSWLNPDRRGPCGRTLPAV
jgi:hypothetical protein